MGKNCRVLKRGVVDAARERDTGTMSTGPLLRSEDNGLDEETAPDR